MTALAMFSTAGHGLEERFLCERPTTALSLP